MKKIIQFEIQTLNRYPVKYSIRLDEHGKFSIYCDRTNAKLYTHDRLGEAYDHIDSWECQFTKVRAVC